MQENKSPPRDFRQEVTDAIIQMLEEGTAPWQKPWHEDGSGRLPYNPTTGKPYRGGNVMWLMAKSMSKGYADPRWCTYKQAADNEWQVRKGEKGTQIEFWDVKPGQAEEEGDEKGRNRLIHRVYTVFNASQIDGMPALVIEPRDTWQVCAAGEDILTRSGADIRYGGGRAFYRKDGDFIQLPPRECFDGAPGFYGTAIHELIHWTGGEARLKRPTLLEAKSFGDEPYSREELRAELGSMMLAAERGIPHDPSQHAAYVASWIKALKNDKNEIFRAAADASKAADYILGLEQGRAEDAPSHVERVTASRAAGARGRG